MWSLLLQLELVHEVMIMASHWLSMLAEAKLHSPIRLSDLPLL